VEIWQRILLKAVETGEGSIFMTSCTPYTFLYFVSQQMRLNKEPYLDYLQRRGRLRLVCRAWNEFVLISSHRWLHLDEGSRMYDLDSTTRGSGGVRPVEKLSTTITSEGMVVPILSWASHILQRPADQSPLRAYGLGLFEMHTREYNPFDYLVGSAPESPEYTNTTLQSLSISTIFGSVASISFPQISSTFVGLRSLFLVDVTATPQQTIALPQLELLYVHYTIFAFHMLPVHTWDTPALRHAYVGQLSTPSEFASARRLPAAARGTAREPCAAGALHGISGPPRGFLGCVPRVAPAWCPCGHPRAAGLGRLDRRPAHNPSSAVPRVLVNVARGGYGRSCAADVDVS